MAKTAIFAVLAILNVWSFQSYTNRCSNLLEGRNYLLSNSVQLRSFFIQSLVEHKPRI